MFLEWENNSGKFQNNAINDVRQLLLSHVINMVTKFLLFRIKHIIESGFILDD